ncbi:MAG: hypothetical protein CO132_03505 [Candidatus Kerfeldbacteria bacterium CG_4_9_14_3_um_filter_45_8]|nr:MAG: hypothetical protein CO132_03505 [Candidatus Kerfeldbacteria bacterium CG_4_9_14_3_um_filter_45_8]
MVAKKDTEVLTETKSGSEKPNEAKVESWRPPFRLTVLVLVFFTLLGIVTARIYIGTGADSAVDFQQRLERFVPVYALDK